MWSQTRPTTDISARVARAKVLLHCPPLPPKTLLPSPPSDSFQRLQPPSPPPPPPQQQSKGQLIDF